MRAALIGCGHHAEMHRRVLARVGADLVALADPDPQRAADAAKGTPGCQPYTDVAQMLGEARPDVVHIVTPPRTHSALAIQAMSAGAHAVVEKPMALSAGEADAMLATAAAHGVRCVAMHNYLWKPSVLKACRLVDEGAIGEVVYVDAYYGLSRDEKARGIAHWSLGLPGGCFTNYFPHLIYLQERFLGGIRGISGVTVGRGSNGDPAEVTVLVEGARGPGVMAVSTRASPYAKSVRIHGTKGIVHVDLVTEITTLNRARQMPRLVSKVVFNAELVSQLATGTVRNTIRVATRAMTDMPELTALFADVHARLERGTDRRPGSAAKTAARSPGSSR